MINKKTYPLLFTFFLDCFHNTITSSVIPLIIAHPHYSILPPDISASTQSILIGILFNCYFLGGFCATLFWGPLADRYNYRIILPTTLLGWTIGLGATAYGIITANIIILIIARLFSGLFAANLTIAQAGIVIENRENKNPSQILSIGEAAIGMGYITAGLVNKIPPNLFSTGYSFALVAFLAMLNAFIFIIYNYFHKNKNNHHHTQPGNHELIIEEQLQEATTPPKKLLERMVELKAILAIWAIFVFGWILFMQFFPTYLIKQYLYSKEDLGALFMYFGFAYFLLQVFIVRPLSSSFSMETILTYVFPLISLASFGMIYASSLPWAYAIITLYLLGLSCAIPNLLATITSQAPKSAQGQVFGITWAIQAITVIVSTSVGTGALIVSNTLPLIIAGLAVMTSWICFMIIKKPYNYS